MIRTADTFEPMGPFKVAMAKDIGIEVDGVEKSVQEAFDDLDFENLGKEEIEKVNELPDWEDADENKLYVVKSSSEPINYTKLVSYYDQGGHLTNSLILYGSNSPNDSEGNGLYTVMPNNLTETEFIKSIPSLNKMYYLPSEKYFYVSRQALSGSEDHFEIVNDNWAKMSISYMPASFIEIDHIPTAEENNTKHTELNNVIFWIVTEQSQSNDSGKLQIYLKDTSKTDCWFMIKVDNDALPVMNIIDENNNITSVPVDKVYFKPISIDDIWEE